MTTLTYLAQVRQNSPPQPYKRGRRIHSRVLITLPFLPTRPSKKTGSSHREIVIIGIVLAVVWVGQNRNTVEWFWDAGSLDVAFRYISSLSRAKEGK